MSLQVSKWNWTGWELKQIANGCRRMRKHTFWTTKCEFGKQSWLVVEQAGQCIQRTFQAATGSPWSKAKLSPYYRETHCSPCGETGSVSPQLMVQIWGQFILGMGLGLAPTSWSPSIHSSAHCSHFPPILRVFFSILHPPIKQGQMQFMSWRWNV